MLKVKVDVVYTAELYRAGTSVRGEYEMVLLKADGKDRARIPIWVQNVPCGVSEGSKFKIKEIVGAGIRHIPPSDSFDRWQDEFSLDAVLMPV